MTASVWVTRARPAAEATARRVHDAGLRPFVAPLLEVAVQPVGADLAGVAALAFTSANAVRAFEVDPVHRDLPVFAVGDATARAAREAGFSIVHAGIGDVSALAETIASACLAGVVLHPRAAEPAHDLVAILDQEGVRARDVVVYRTEVAALGGADLEAAGACDFVLLQSAKAARALRHLDVPGPRPVCQSPAISDALGDPRARVASLPNEDALIAALLTATR